MTTFVKIKINNLQIIDGCKTVLTKFKIIFKYFEQNTINPKEIH